MPQRVTASRDLSEKPASSGMTRLDQEEMKKLDTYLMSLMLPSLRNPERIVMREEDKEPNFYGAFVERILTPLRSLQW
jgi:hypothetical protein